MSDQAEKQHASTVIAGRVCYDQSNLVNGQFSATALTDGLVIAVLGTVSDNLSVDFAGLLNAATTLDGTTTSSVVTAASTKQVTMAGGKKGAVTIYLPSFGNLTMAVRRGETWTLSLLAPPSGAGVATPDLIFYWVELAVGGSHHGTVAHTASPAGDVLSAAFQRLRDAVHTGGPVGTRTGETVAVTQRVIDDRVGDFVRVLGDAAAMGTAEADRQRFIADLQAIVCRATPDGTQAQDVRPDKLETLVGTFAGLTGRDLGEKERQLLMTAIQALVAINETERSRHDLALIQRNVAFFIDSVATALGREIDGRNRRLLTRALVRLVGDGAALAETAGALPVAAE